MVLQKMVQVLECTCSRCGATWRPVGEPRRCGVCKSQYWNKPRILKKHGGRPKKSVALETIAQD